MRARLLLALAMLTVGCEEDVPPSGALRGTPSAEALWVVTYNVNFERPSDETVQAIGEIDADVVFLQETHARWERRIRDALGERYPHIELRHEDAEGGMAILSRHAIESVEHGRSPDGAFPAWRVRVDTPLGELDVLHVHLHPPLGEDGRLITGYFTTGPARLAELRHHLGDDTPDLVLGDFNEGEGDAIDLLESLGMNEAQPAHPPLERTWSWVTGGTELEGRPDHVFAGPGLRITGVQVLQLGGSDHRPLRVALEARR